MKTDPPTYDQSSCEHEFGREYYPCCAWAFAVLLFPIGILCCLRMKIKECKKCGLEVELENGQNQPLNSASYRTGFAIGAISQAVHNPIL
jgi:Uncharacterized conserved protein (DUF2367)